MAAHQAPPSLGFSRQEYWSGVPLRFSLQFSSVQWLSRVQLFVTPWIAAHQASLSITNSRSSPKLMSIESVMPSSHLILCNPLLLLPPIPPSIRVFSNESTLCVRWPKYWSFSLSISSSNEYSELICFRTNWFDFLVVQGTLKSLLQHYSLKASILWCSAFLPPYMTTGKTIALTRQCGRPGFEPWVGKIPWRRKWQPTPVLLPGKSHGQRSLVGYSLWGHKESDTTERLHFTWLDRPLLVK